jgi:hypothetical protein
MTKSSVAIVITAVGLVAGAVSSTVVAQEKQAVSKPSQKTLKAAQDACTAKKYDECSSKAREGLGISGATGYDRFVANQLLAFAAARSGNNAEAARAMEAMLESGFGSAADQNNWTKGLASVAYQQKNYARSAELGQRLIRNGGGDADTYTLVAQSYYLQDKYREAAKFLSDFVVSQEGRGQTPREQSLQLIGDSYRKLGDNAAATAALEKLVGYYPKPNYWNNLLYSMLRTPSITDRQTLQVFRLMHATGTLSQPSDYTEMAQLAIEQSASNEAKTVLEAAMAGNVFTDQTQKDRNTRLLEAAKKSAATEQAGLAKFEMEAKAAKAGEADVSLGRSYLSLGMNDKAIEAITRGMGKGSLKQPEEAQLLLGIAHYRQKNIAEADKAFRALKSTDALYQRLAKLWALHAK